ncbi:hypothetical protein PFTANZ_00129 [Plasmodium falciparum Tanzania (2000708)]|uniref:Eukaryotic translation initiation factor 4E n=1 Tax=Plasmodium falciparum Tanzania (2000708) TaxID=1036725 RepID=A0A024WFC2_PLAFA|nr:hypothetical protein PFTANZ_00129 [Plasmodium falciparum Tanzania (2000708)]
MEGNDKCLNVTLADIEKDTMKNNLSLNSKGNELLNNKKSGYKNNIKKKKKKSIKENNGNEQNKGNGTLTLKNEENDSKVFKTYRNKRNSKNDNMEKHKNDVTKNENDITKNENDEIIKEDKNSNLGKTNGYNIKDIRRKKKDNNKEYIRDHMKKKKDIIMNNKGKKNNSNNNNNDNNDNNDNNNSNNSNNNNNNNNSNEYTKRKNTHKKHLNEHYKNESNKKKVNEKKYNNSVYVNNNIKKNHVNKNKNENYLQNVWLFLFDNEVRKENEQCVGKIISLDTFNTIEKFYKNYKYMKSPSAIKEYYNIYLFKHNFRPLFDEYPNGFICTVKNANHFKNDSVDIIWEKMVLLAIGEEFSLIDLCGLQLCIRDNEMFFKIWMKNYSNYLKNILMKKLKDLLGLPHNTSLVIRNLSNVYNNKKNQQGKGKNEKAKKNYNKNNKGAEFVASKKDSLKMHNYPNIVPPPNYLGNYNVYKYNLDMNLFYLYNNQNMPNPYIYIPVNVPNNQYNNIYPDYMYDSNTSYPIDIINNNLLSNDINVPSNFVNNKMNGSIIVDKKSKIDYGLKNEDYKKKSMNSLNSNDIYEDSKSTTCIKSVYTDDEYEYNNSSNNNNNISYACPGDHDKTFCELRKNPNESSILVIINLKEFYTEVRLAYELYIIYNRRMKKKNNKTN